MKQTERVLSVNVLQHSSLGFTFYLHCKNHLNNAITCERSRAKTPPTFTWIATFLTAVSLEKHDTKNNTQKSRSK